MLSQLLYGHLRSISEVIYLLLGTLLPVSYCVWVPESKEDINFHQVKYKEKEAKLVFSAF